MEAVDKFPCSCLFCDQEQFIFTCDCSPTYRSNCNCVRVTEIGNALRCNYCVDTERESSGQVSVLSLIISIYILHVRVVALYLSATVQGNKNQNIYAVRCICVAYTLRNDSGNGSCRQVSACPFILETVYFETITSLRGCVHTQILDVSVLFRVCQVSLKPEQKSPCPDCVFNFPFVVLT